MRVTNHADVSLPLAVWLLHDEYDHIRGVTNYLSATTLMKPIRQIILPGRVPIAQQESDVTDYVARKLGTAIHDSIEKSWTSGGFAQAMTQLGYPQEAIDRIRINPSDEELRAKNDIIPVYLEQREMRQVVVDGTAYTIGGKFDMIADGQLNDFKSTSVFSWIKGTKDKDYALQGSLYRWLNPMKVSEEYIRINFIFTDWQKASAFSQPNYPPQRVMHKDIPLMSIQETENWIKAKLRQIEKYKAMPEADIPHCTDEELWRSAPVFKFFSDPAKAQTPGAKSTKNFDTLSEANAFMASKGGKGVVVTKPGEAKACGYCAGFDVCTQKDSF